MSSSSNHIIDTVVLPYFLLVKETGLLCTLLGRPLQVPLAVYDPEDRTLPPAALRRADLLSEMRQSIRHYEHAVTSDGLPNPLATTVGYVDMLYDQGALVPVPMTPDERLLAAKLQSSEVADYGLSVPLGAGEAACIAISYHRGWTIATRRQRRPQSTEKNAPQPGIQLRTHPQATNQSNSRRSHHASGSEPHTRRHAQPRLLGHWTALPVDLAALGGRRVLIVAGLSRSSGLGCRNL